MKEEEFVKIESSEDILVNNLSVILKTAEFAGTYNSLLIHDLIIKIRKKLHNIQSKQ